jgi:hypothetical protein
MKLLIRIDRLKNNTEFSKSKNMSYSLDWLSLMKVCGFLKYINSEAEQKLMSAVNLPKSLQSDNEWALKPNSREFCCFQGIFGIRYQLQ